MFPILKTSRPVYENKFNQFLNQVVDHIIRSLYNNFYLLLVQIILEFSLKCV